MAGRPDHLFLEGGEEALGHRIVERVADAAHRGDHAAGAQRAAEVDRGVLGGFNWSSQHRLGDVNIARRGVLRWEFASRVFCGVGCSVR